MVTVTAMSDLHGNLPLVSPCDLLLIAGDLTPGLGIEAQADWLDGKFRNWLERVPAREVVAVAGNHDWIFERAPQLVPRLRWHYLQDGGVELFGLKIYGTPWQPRFFDWAFNLDEPELAIKFNQIPEGTDIVVCHGPPLGFGDLAPRLGGGEHVGSPSLLNRVLAVRPQLCVFGHIHEGRGVYQHDGVTFANVSVVDHRYDNVYTPMVFQIEPRNRPTPGTASAG
ncbi:MAG TPA: metallophosphoesterase [Gemmataceae bacterium]|nr:metallophosphoesterase [Gemmataceae bacterium]